jgi:hypothetical protein
VDKKAFQAHIRGIHKVTTAFLRIQSVAGEENDIDVGKEEPAPPRQLSANTMTAIIAQQGPASILAPADRTQPALLAAIAEELAVDGATGTKQESLP